MSNRVNNININILKQCREQIGLDISDVEKKVKKIVEFELGENQPTFKQLDTLAELYNVPRWVFISESLPDEFTFTKSLPAFRQFSENYQEAFSNPKVRSIISKIEQLRELMLDFLVDIDEDTPHFSPPKPKASPKETAQQVREWLGASNRKLNFLEWKKLLEIKGIFVFLTSKYKDWSNVEKVFRGLTIYHPILPIIIVNNADAKKAQLFTIFHELGHLLRKENTIDQWDYEQQNIENWCDEFAGNVLMPESEFMFTAIKDLKSVKEIAANFHVSTYACLVRLRRLNIISQSTYDSFLNTLIHEYKTQAEKMKKSKGGPARDRPKEILNQYGSIFVNTMFQAYHNKEIGLQKLSKLFGLKKISHVFEMEKQL